jgi:NhaA family Na+:H+ antiporter
MTTPPGSKPLTAFPAAPVDRWLAPITRFLHIEAASGVALLACTAVALALANSPAAEWFAAIWKTPVSLSIGWFVIEGDVGHLIVNDGLMTVFFFVVGLEVKRELVVGELTDRKAAALPVLAAVGGMIVPALVYLAVAGVAPGTGRVWAVPTATDIAFALGVLAVAGSAAPVGLRLFLLSLAVVDDLGAIALIALLYTDSLRLPQLAGAAILLVVYALAQRRRITTPFLYLPLAAAVWLCVHDSGIHATVAGVALGLLTRVRADDGEEHSPAERLEHRIQPWSAGLVVPVFAFTAAGVAVSASATSAATSDRAAQAVFLGLVVGKLLGVLGAAWLAVRLGLAALPDRVGWVDVTAVAALAGTGFTVSLLLTRLAFPDPGRGDAVTLALLVASVLSSVLGACIIRARRSTHLDDDPAA